MRIKRIRFGCCALGILLLLSFMAGCAPSAPPESETPVETVLEMDVPDSVKWYHYMEQFSALFPRVPDGFLQAGLATYENVPLSRMTVHPYEQVFCTDERANSLYGLTGVSMVMDLPKLTDRWPVERLEMLDEDHICVTYAFSDENTDIGRFYLYGIFTRSVHGMTPDGTAEYEDWSMKYNERYYCSKSLSYQDYQGIQAGDPLEAVAQIDPTVYIEQQENTSEYYRFDTGSVIKWTPPDQDTIIRGTPKEGSPGELVRSFRSYRLLTDGVLVISFRADCIRYNAEGENDFGDFQVVQTTFYPYGSEEAPAYAAVLSCREKPTLP